MSDIKFILQFFGGNGSNSSAGKMPGEALLKRFPEVKNWDVSQKWKAKTDYSEEIKEIRHLLAEGKKSEAKKIFDSCEDEWRKRQSKRHKPYTKVSVEIARSLMDDGKMWRDAASTGLDKTLKQKLNDWQKANRQFSKWQDYHDGKLERIDKADKDAYDKFYKKFMG